MKEMTKEQMSARVRELGKVLDNPTTPKDEWKKAYSEYCDLENRLDEIYRQENQKDFDAYYEKHIKGKTWEEIDKDAWDFYSDWHKDMYGYRPRHI